MKIKTLVSMAGVNFSWSPGDVVEVDDAEASRLITAELAVPVRDAETETADAAGAPETADAPPRPRKRAPKKS